MPGLEEFMKRHPNKGTVDSGVKETADNYRQELADRERINCQKMAIIQQLEQGSAPQFILLTAIRTISLSTHDEEFERVSMESLKAIYGDLEQQSMDTERMAMQVLNLDQAKTDYQDKLQRRLEGELRRYKNIEKSLCDALKEVKRLKGEEASRNDDME